MERRLDMRQEIHPEYTEIKATCSCGNVMVIKSTLKEDIKLDVCSACHPFYTGEQKLIDTGGRVERFEKRFGKKRNPKDQNKEDLIKEPEVVKAEVPKKAKEEGAPEEIEEKTPEKKVAAKKVTSKKASQKETKPKKESGEK